MEVFYTSPVTQQQFIIPLLALATYKKRDAALQKIIDLGGLNWNSTPPSSELLRQHKIMMAAKRKIKREGWFSLTVERV